MKPLQRYVANNAKVATPLTTPTSPKLTTLRQSICNFSIRLSLSLFPFSVCVLSIKIYQRIYSRKSDNNSVTRGKARFIYIQLQLHCNLSRVRRLPQGSLLHEPVTSFTSYLTYSCKSRNSKEKLLKQVGRYQKTYFR